MKGKAKAASGKQVRAEGNGMKNYIRLGENLYQSEVSYMYLDTEEMLLAGLNGDYRLGLGEAYILGMEGEKYRLVMVRFSPDREEDFLKALEELKDVMLFNGCRDYLSHGGQLIAQTEGMLCQELETKGCAGLPDGGMVFENPRVVFSKEEWRKEVESGIL